MESDLQETPELVEAESELGSVESEETISNEEEIVAEDSSLKEITDHIPQEEPLEEITEIVSAGNLEKVEEDSQVEVVSNTLDVFSRPIVKDNYISALGSMSMELNPGRLHSNDEAVFSLPDGFGFQFAIKKEDATVTSHDVADVNGYYIMNDSDWSQITNDGSNYIFGNPNGNHIKIKKQYESSKLNSLYEYSNSVASPFKINQISNNKIQLIVADGFDNYTDSGCSYFELHLRNVYVKNGFEGDIKLEITETGGGFMSTSGRTVGVAKSGSVTTESTNQLGIIEEGTIEYDLIGFRVSEIAAGSIDNTAKSLSYNLPSGLQWAGEAKVSIVSGNIGNYKSGDSLNDIIGFVSYSDDKQEMYLNFDPFADRSSSTLEIYVSESIVVKDLSKLTEGDIAVNINSNGETKLTNNSFAGLAYKKIYSGKCGYNLTWIFNTESGVITINGTGEMSYYYSGTSYAPWSSYRSFIKEVNLSEGVASIGESAFYDCDALSSVIFPAGLTKIGESAFYDCDALNSVIFPTGLTKIGESAFYDCDALNSVIFPAGLTKIGESAFYDCDALGSVSFPKGLTTIGKYAFYDCDALDSIALLAGLTDIGKYAFYNCNALSYVSLPEEITIIGDNAFSNCNSLQTINFPEGLTSIGYFAFMGCDALSYISLPESLTSLGDNVFANCRSLKDILIAEDNSAYCSIDGVLFNKDKTYLIQYPAGKENNTYITPSSVTSIGEYAFYKCYLLTSVTLPDKLTNIGDGAFYGCESLSSAHFKGNIPNNFGKEVFAKTAYDFMIYYLKDKSGWQSPTWHGYNTKVQCGDNLIWDFDEGTGVLTISGSGDMYDYTWLSSDAAPWYNFRSSIKEVELAGSVISIGNYAFNGCSSLDSVILPEGLTSIGDGAFSDCYSLTSIDLPEGLTSIGTNAFCDCESLTSLTLPEGLTNFGSGAFGSCISLKNILVSENNSQYDSTAGVLFSKDQTCLIQYPAGKEGNTYTVPNSVTSIGDGAFYGCESLISLALPEGLTSIGDSAFCYCKSLTSIDLPEGLTSIGDNAFYYCKSLTSIGLPEGLTSIGDSAFCYCKSLTSIDLPEGLTSIGDSAFYYCESLTSLILPKNLTSIGDEAFADCYSLTSIDLPEGLTRIGKYAFADCYSLTSIVLPESLTSIGSYAFYGCRYLGFACFKGDAPTNFSHSAFYDFADDFIIYYLVGKSGWTTPIWNGYPTKIKGTVQGIWDNLAWSFDAVSRTLTITGQGAIANETGNPYPWSTYDTKLNKLEIGEGITSIGEGAFAGCRSLASIDLPESLTSIGDDAFYGCEFLGSAYFKGDAPTDFGGEVFYDTADDFTIYYLVGKSGWITPTWNDYSTKEQGTEQGTWGELAWSFDATSRTLTITGQGAITNETATPCPWSTYCAKLTKLEIGEGITSIGDYVFYGCNSLTSLTLPESLTRIGSNAFAGCHSLNSLTLPENLTGIEYEAFANCESLSSAYFKGDAPTDFDWGMFYDTDYDFTIYYLEGKSGWTTPTWEGYKSAIYIPTSTSVTGVSLDKITLALDGGEESNLKAIVAPANTTNKAITWTSSDPSIATVDNNGKVTAIAGGETMITVTTKDGGFSATCQVKVTPPKKCGENLKWKFNQETGLLTISGTGTMYNYQPSSNLTVLEATNGMPPWQDYCKSIKKISLPEGLTGIGDYAFAGCTSLKTVTLPPSLNSLGKGVFAGCTALEEAYFQGQAPTAADSEIFADTAADFKIGYVQGQEGWENNSWQGYPVETYLNLPGVFGGASLSLQSELAVNFQVAKNYFLGQKAGQAGIQFNDQEELAWDLAQDNGDYYGFNYRGLAAKKMADPIQAVLFKIGSDGKQQFSQVLNYSVADYMGKILGSNSYDNKLKTFLVDLANYGTAAQNYFNYNTANPLNAAVADYQDLASETIQFTDEDFAYSVTSTGKAIKDFELALKLENRIEAALRVKDSGGYAVEDLILQVEYYDLNGNLQTWQMDGAKQDFVSNPVIFNKLSAEQMDDVFRISVLDRSGETVSETATYSITSYAVWTDRNSEDAQLKDLTNKMVQVGRSAAKYFDYAKQVKF